MANTLHRRRILRGRRPGNRWAQGPKPPRPGEAPATRRQAATKKKTKKKTRTARRKATKKKTARRKASGNRRPRGG